MPSRAKKLIGTLGMIWILIAQVYCQINLIIAIFNGAKESESVMGFVFRTIIAVFAYQIFGLIISMPGYIAIKVASYSAKKAQVTTKLLLYKDLAIIIG